LIWKAGWNRDINIYPGGENERQIFPHEIKLVSYISLENTQKTLDCIESVLKIFAFSVVVIGIYQFLVQIKEKESLSISESWKVINSYKNEAIDGGRVDAIEMLHQKDQNLFGLNLSKAKLMHLSAPPNKLGGLQLQNSDLKGANLSYSYLVKSNLGYTDFSSLSGTSAEKGWRTEIIQANLSEANLKNAVFKQVNIKYSCFKDALLNSETLFYFDSPDDFIGADFTHAIDVNEAKFFLKNGSKFEQVKYSDLIKQNLLGKKEPPEGKHGCDQMPKATYKPYLIL
jgi:uncharacterized protein YjbI with pentapeptide repeats